MAIKEDLHVHSYAVYEERKSRIDPEATIRVEVGLRCPRCKLVGPVIRHNQTDWCRGCRLQMTVHGNCLECLMQEGAELSKLLGKAWKL